MGEAGISRLKKLAIVTTHPIQYNAPVFRMLEQRSNIKIKVYYTWGESVLNNKFDPGFGKTIEWDIPLLEGYDHVFITNTAVEPGSHHFSGIKNPGLIGQLIEDKPDAILVFGWSFHSHLRVMRYFKGKIPVFFRGDSTLLDEQPGFSLKKLLRRRFLRWVYGHIDRVLYVGAANQRYFKAMGIEAQQLIFVPHAIDNDRFSNALKLLNTTRVNQQVRFLFCGKFEPKKNPELLLAAFIELNHPQSELLMVGDGVLEERLKATVEELPEMLKKRISFLPFQNQQKMPDIYQLGDVFVLPSKGPGETWGLAVNEAMASGKPVIVSNKCGCAEDLVEDGVNGFVFNSDAPGALLNAMRQMMDKRDCLLQFGQRSETMIQQWSYQQLVPAIEEIVTALPSR